MTFEEFCEIMKQSIAKQGYDQFYPMLVIDDAAEDAINMNVLEGDLSSDGEEEVAKAWAAEFDAPHKFLAYRAGNRHIQLCEFLDNDVKDEVSVRVLPYENP